VQILRCKFSGARTYET